MANLIVAFRGVRLCLIDRVEACEYWLGEQRTDPPCQAAPRLIVAAGVPGICLLRGPIPPAIWPRRLPGDQDGAVHADLVGGLADRVPTAGRFAAAAALPAAVDFSGECLQLLVHR